MSYRHKIIFLADESKNSENQEAIIDKEKLWEKVKKVTVSSKEGRQLEQKFGISFFPVFILRNNEIKPGIIGHDAIRDALDLRKFRGK